MGVQEGIAGKPDPMVPSLGDVAGDEARASGQASGRPGWGALLAGRNGVCAVVLAGGVALDAINVYIATTILPSVVADIGGLDLYAWNTTIFVVASIIGSALAPRLLQRTGPRGAYGVAALAFAAGALACALAPSMSAMLLGRLIQGIGGGLLFALAYSMIRIVFDAPLWSRAMALVSGMWGVATLLGPAVGGVFAQWGAWRAAFGLVAPIALLFALLAISVLPRRDAKFAPGEGVAVPFRQIGLLTLAVLAVSTGSAATGPVFQWLGIGVALLFTAGFVRLEMRSAKKLLPSGVFRRRSVIAALYVSMSLLIVTVTSSEIFVPLFLQVLHHQSPLVSGYLAALMAGGWTLGAFASAGAGPDRTRRLFVLGPSMQLAGVLALFMLVPYESEGAWTTLVPLCVALLATGCGVGIVWPHLLAHVLRAVPPEDAGVAGASITTVQLFATAVGAALAGMLANAGGLVNPGGVSGTAQAARWLFGAFALAPLLSLLVARRRQAAR